MGAVSECDCVACQRRRQVVWRKVFPPAPLVVQHAASILLSDRRQPARARFAVPRCRPPSQLWPCRNALCTASLMHEPPQCEILSTFALRQRCTGCMVAAWAGACDRPELRSSRRHPAKQLPRARGMR